MTQLTAQQLDDAAFVESLANGDQPLLLDLSDERQYRYAAAMHEIAGHTAESRPGLFAGLEAAREVHAENGPGDPAPSSGPWQSGGVVTNLGLSSTVQGAAAAAGFTGYVEGALQVNAAMVVVPSNGGAVLASGSSSDFGDGTYVPVVTNPVQGQSAASSMRASLVCSYQLKAGEQWKTEVVPLSAQLGTQGDPEVEQPKTQSWTTHPAYIKVAVGRGEGDPNDCDYWLGKPGEPSNYYVPFKGYVDFSSPPPSATSLQLNQNVFISGKLARCSMDGKGGHKDLPASEAQLLFESLQVSGNRMSWNRSAPSWEPGQDYAGHGNSINWEDVEWATKELDYLTIQFQVLLSSNPVQWGVATVQSSDQKDPDPMDGTKNIPPLQFVYSCLAEGTLILMADGSRKAIENVQRGELIKAGDGTEREVACSYLGYYTGKVLEITAGESIVLSHNHVVAKAGGEHCFASELQAGDTVNSPEGPVEVTSVREVDFDGALCNLSLSEPGAPVDPSRNSMFAGPSGIEVCDYEVQGVWESRGRTSKEAVLAALEPEYHPDYLNYLAEEEAAS